MDAFNKIKEFIFEMTTFLDHMNLLTNQALINRIKNLNNYI
jgi:hypothetical protein